METSVAQLIQAAAQERIASSAQPALDALAQYLEKQSRAHKIIREVWGDGTWSDWCLPLSCVPYSLRRSHTALAYTVARSVIETGSSIEIVTK